MDPRQAYEIVARLVREQIRLNRAEWATLDQALEALRAAAVKTGEQADANKEKQA